MKSKILVTGGAGFVGSALAEKLADNADNFVVVVDNLLTGSMRKVPASKHNNVKFIKADVNDFSDISSIFYAYAFDYVFHYAAVVGVKRTLDHPSWVLKDLTGLKTFLTYQRILG